MRIIVLMARDSPWSQQIAAGLQDDGHEVHVFDFKNVPSNGYIDPSMACLAPDLDRFVSRVSGVHLADAPETGIARYVCGAAALFNTVRKLRPQVVLSLYGGGFALMAYASTFRPYCVYLVGSDVLHSRTWAHRLSRLTLGQAKKLFANGNYLALKAEEQVPGAVVMPLLIGVDLGLFEQAQPEERTVQFVCTRGFMSVYNNDAIVRAVGNVSSKVEKFRVVFTSGGPGLDKSRAFAESILPSHLRDRIHFLGGVSFERLRQELHKSHAVLSMARSDGTSISVLEGMACGLYPILSDIPQNRALIRPGESVGTLVPLDDDSSLVKALSDMVSQATSRAEAARQNRQFISRVADSRTNRRILSDQLTAVVGESSRIQ